MKNKIVFMAVLCIFLTGIISGCIDNNGDAKDSDDDGVPDDEDVFPNDPNEQFDNDNDNIGDNADLDDDNDGYTDEEELDYGSDPYDIDSIPGEDDDGDKLTNQLENKIGTNPNNVDTDNDGLNDYFEFFTAGTNPKSPSTDGDRYSDYDEWYDLTPAYVKGNGRLPLSPAVPDIRLIPQNLYTIYLAQEIQVGEIHRESKAYTFSSTSIEQTTTQYGIDAEVPIIAPWNSVVRAHYSKTHTSLLINNETYSFATVDQWSKSVTTNLPDSYIQVVLEIMNVGTDILRDEIHISINLYIGNSSILKTQDIVISDIPLTPDELPILRSVEFKGFMTTDILMALDSGKAIRIEPHYAFGEDQTYLFSVQQRSIELEVDNGTGVTTDHIYLDGNVSLNNFLQENAELETNNGNISSMYNLPNNPPDGWWEILLPTKSQSEVSQNPLDTIMKPGDHVVLVYYKDIDHDNITNRQERVLGLNPLSSDTDSDGIDDYKESFGNIGTNPLLNDTDSDNMPDGWEFSNNLNPLVDDSSEDPDQDGLTNLEEYLNGVNPQNSDTDSDQIPDDWEIKHNLNPNNSSDAEEDPDRDLLTNREEYIYGADPYEYDTDGDTIKDGEEISKGTNPNDSDTDDDGYWDNDDYLPTKNAKIVVHLIEFEVIDDVELIGDAEIFFKIIINDDEKRVPETGEFNGEKGKPTSIGESVSFDISDNIAVHEINIEMWDNDPLKSNKLDINGNGTSKDLTVYYNIVTDQWEGDDNDGRTDGSDDGTQNSDDDDCYLKYDIKTI